jgi:acyl carrier protein
MLTLATVLLFVGAFARPTEAALHGGPQATASADSAVPASLRAVIAKTLKVDQNKVTATASFVKDLGADELSLVELVMAYEREYKVNISNAEADQFHQVRDVIAYLKKKGALK